ncbi:MAG: S-adenosylmethionine:tRNA ribosyltransferase-isomerase [Chitinophagaceae bacterium]|nr:S-adenosylmethionine:tRNA ribosyltransferase-isomerase [Chitinophagaceae bacterium]
MLINLKITPPLEPTPEKNSHPGTIAISEYDYALPEDRIAYYPLTEREGSKLLVYRNKTIAESRFRNIADIIPGDSLVVLNNTKVMEARLLFQKPTGGQIEIFCLEPDGGGPDIGRAMLEQKTADWKCLVGKAAKWKPGAPLEKKIAGPDGALILRAIILKKAGDHFIVRFSWFPETLSFAEILHWSGAIPLPPYIKRKPDAADAERYQTVYAQNLGSVAAPTAGLHFTPGILQGLSAHRIRQDFITLHVGAGTFKPVKSERMQEHEMHAEYIELSKSVVENIYRFADKHITAVGTTSFRAVESLYWIGLQLIAQKETLPGLFTVGQWEPYQDRPRASAKASLEAVLTWMEKTGTDKLIARTSLLIAPGCPINIPHALATNFHQPRSTLLLLVAAFIGEDWKNVYSYALENGFRFLSYGDGCLLFRS